MNTAKQSYFQYFKDFDYPLGISIDLEIYDTESFNTLKLLGFSEITREEWNQKKKKFRKIEILPPSPAMLSYIGQSSRQGFKDAESLLMKAKHKIYKFQNRGALEFSERHFSWKLYLIDPASYPQGYEMDFMHILNRAISWSLIEANCIGFWGVPVVEGLIGMKANESNSEAFFIDLANQRILSIDGAAVLPAKLQILRLDSTLDSRFLGMSPEELYSFLIHRATLFHPIGSHMHVKRAVIYLASNVKGLIWPKNDFTPRKELREAA